MRSETQPYSTVLQSIAIRLCRTAHAIFPQNQGREGPGTEVVPEPLVPRQEDRRLGKRDCCLVCCC